MTTDRVAYVGPEGTFTHRAALRLAATTYAPARSIRGVFDLLLRGEADRGVVPAENALEGPVHETLDLLVSRDLLVTGEITLAIEHVLLGHPGAAPRRVYSHPQALAQCAAWLDTNAADAVRIECVSTGEAAALAVGDPAGAAIAPGRRAGLEVLATGLAPSTNETRFLVLGGAKQGPSGHDVTLVAFAAPHRPGALHACLEPFARLGLNLTRIESRPSRERAWTYRFLAEFEGHASEDTPKQALADLGRIAPVVKILGSWPRARDRESS